MSITDVIESNETKRRAWFSSGFWLPAGHSVVVVDSADPDVDGSAEIRERNEILQELNRIVQQQRWIPVSEAHPPANKMVLVCIGSTNRVMMCSIDMSGVWAGYQPTHWMPLPEPPKEVQG
jgi:hypothetical protein